MLERPMSKAGWTRVALGDVARNINDYFDRDTDEPIRFIAGEHVDEGQLKVRRWGMTDDGFFPPTFKRKFKAGDALFHSRNIKKVAVPDFDGVTGEKLFVLRSKDEGVLLQEFLGYLLSSEHFSEYAERNWSGSVNKFFNWKPLSKYEFLLPPIQEQARLLEPLLGVRTLEEGLGAALEIGEKTYEAWIESELKDHDWPVRPAIDLLTRATVGIVVKPADWYVSSGQGVPALRSLNVLKNRLSWNDYVEISQEGHKFHQKSALRAGDVVIVRSGRPGDAAVIPELDHPLNAIDLIISTTGPDLRPEFFCRFLNSVAGRRQFASGIAGTAQLHFNVELFKKLRIPVPPLSEQDVFIARAQQFDGTINDLRARLANARELKKMVLKECVAHELQ